jgi:hypothetical protein
MQDKTFEEESRLFLKEMLDIVYYPTISLRFDPDDHLWNMVFSCNLEPQGKTYRSKLVMSAHESYETNPWVFKRYFARIKYDMLQLKGVQHAN